MKNTQSITPFSNLPTMGDQTIENRCIDLSQLRVEFLSEQDVRESSRKVYGRSLNQFFTWLQDESIEFVKLTPAHIIAYKAHMADQEKGVKTIALYLAVIRKFFGWAKTNGLCSINIAEGIKAPKIANKFRKEALSLEKSRQLLAYFETSGNLRNYAMVNMMIRTGLRTIEVSRLDVGDIVWKGDKRVINVHGKGRDEKDAFVILSTKAYLPIAEYLGTRETTPNTPLFPSVSNNSKANPRMTTCAIRAIVKVGLKAIDLDAKQFSAHSLRHTMAVNILRAGGLLEDAQEVLRHANSDTTRIYTQTIKEERRLTTAIECRVDNLL